MPVLDVLEHDFWYSIFDPSLNERSSHEESKFVADLTSTQHELSQDHLHLNFWILCVIVEKKQGKLQGGTGMVFDFKIISLRHLKLQGDMTGASGIRLQPSLDKTLYL